MHDNSLKELKVASILTEKIYHLTADGKDWGVFAGIAVPSYIMSVVVLWALSNSVIYSKLISEDDILEIKQTNTEITELFDQNVKIHQILVNYMTKIMKNWSADDFEKMLVHEWN